MGQRKNKILKYILTLSAVVIFIAVVLILAKDNPLDGLENTLGIGNVSDENAQPFSVTCIDVGQGDCALIICDGVSMLIDAGDNGYEENVLKFIHSEGIDRLDYVVCSHLHTDHIGGMPEVIDEFKPYAVIMPAVAPEFIPETVTYGILLESIENSGSEIFTPLPGESFEFGSAEVITFGPVYESENHNDMSLVLKITYSDRSFLFTGDCEKTEENDILLSGADLNCDFLKVSHHGSSNASTVEFLDAVSPAICVISVGADNDYGHPSETVLKRLLKYTDKIYRTDISGNITVSCDGKKLYVSTEK